MEFAFVSTEEIIKVSDSIGRDGSVVPLAMVLLTFTQSSQMWLTLNMKSTCFFSTFTNGIRGVIEDMLTVLGVLYFAVVT